MIHKFLAIVSMLVTLGATLACASETLPTEYVEQQESAEDIVRQVVGPTIVSRQDQVGNWEIWSGQNILGDYQQSVGSYPLQLSCIWYENEGPVTRFNIRFDHSLTSTPFKTDEGEVLGQLRTRTVVADQEVPVEWTTWATTDSRIRLRDESALVLVQSIREADANTFRLELLDDPRLSREYHVVGMLEAMSENDMRCFDTK